MVSIARELLLHDRLRFAITVVGLGVLVGMIFYMEAMFFGVTGDSVGLVERAAAQLWVSKAGDAALNAPSVVALDAVDAVRGVAGVQQVCPLGYSMANLRLPTGRTVQVSLVGLDPACPLLQPWQVTAGQAADLARPDTLAVDDLALRGQAVEVGQIVELNARTLRVAAITHDNKSFSYPFAYVNLEAFSALAGKPGQVSYLMIQTTPGASLAAVRDGVLAATTGLAVSEVRPFEQATISKLISEGVGMIFVVAVVGVLVGMLVIALTMYTATMEQLRDFAILKALGATRRKIWRIVLEQAIYETGVSCVLGLAAALGLNAFVEGVSGIRGTLPVSVAAASIVALLLLSMLSALLSIRKAVRVDPVMVFRA